MLFKAGLENVQTAIGARRQPDATVAVRTMQQSGRLTLAGSAEIQLKYIYLIIKVNNYIGCSAAKRKRIKLNPLAEG